MVFGDDMSEPAPASPRPAAGAPRPTGIGRLTALGLSVVALSIVLLRVQPSRMGELPPDMITPVLALELARTPAEVERLFGAPGGEQRETWRVRMVRGTWVDFGLLVAYGAFLAGVARELGRGTRSLPARLAVALAISAAFFDMLEDRQLLVILSRLGGEYVQSLPRLVLATWGKWFSLAAYFALLAGPLWNARGFFRAAAVAGVIGAGGAALAVPLRGIAAEVMLNGFSVGMAMLVVGAYRERARTARAGS
jgi:hypothetical protein